MKYSIESEYNKVTIELAPKNRLGYMNVPLCRALLKCDVTVYPDDAPRFYVLLQDTQPVARFQMEHGDRDEEKIRKVHSAAQQWLGNEISRLEKLKTDLDILKEAEYAHGSNPKT